MPTSTLLALALLLTACPAIADGQESSSFAARQQPYFSLMNKEQGGKSCAAGPAARLAFSIRASLSFIRHSNPI